MRHNLYLLGLVFLCGCGKSTADLVSEAKSPEPHLRLHAIRSLGQKAGEKEAVLPVLTDALKDENSFVRRDAARALGKFGADAASALPVLRERLRDPDPSVRKAVAQAVKQIDPAASTGK